MSTHQTSVVYKKGMEFLAKIDQHTVEMDAPAEPPSTAASPKKLMLASLAGCTGVDIVSILNKMKVPFSDFTINVEADLTDEHPKIYKDVHVHYYIMVDADHQDKVKRAVELSEEKYCGVMAMFKAFTQVHLHYHFL